MRSLCSLPGGAAVISQGMEDTVHCTCRGDGAHAQSLFAARWRSCDQPGDGGFCTGLIPKNNIFFLLLSFFTFICNFSNYFLLFSFHLCFYFFLLNQFFFCFSFFCFRIGVQPVDCIIKFRGQQMYVFSILFKCFLFLFYLNGLFILFIYFGLICSITLIIYKV